MAHERESDPGNVSPDQRILSYFRPQGAGVVQTWQICVGSARKLMIYSRLQKVGEGT